MKTRKNRCDDFDSRVSYSPGSVYEHRERGWRYIPIHPFSDELEILDRLELDSEQCNRADAYWAVDDDVVFLETIIESVIERDVGIYFRSRVEGGNVAMGVLPSCSISRALFEELMSHCYDTGRLLEGFPDKLTPIKSEQDGGGKVIPFASLRPSPTSP